MSHFSRTPPLSFVCVLLFGAFVALIVLEMLPFFILFFLVCIIPCRWKRLGGESRTSIDMTISYKD